MRNCIKAAYAQAVLFIIRPALQLLELEREKERECARELQELRRQEFRHNVDECRALRGKTQRSAEEDERLRNLLGWGDAVGLDWGTRCPWSEKIAGAVKYDPEQRLR